MTSPLPFQPGSPGQLMTALADIGSDLENVLARSERIYARVQRAAESGDLAVSPFEFTDGQIAALLQLVTDLHNLRQVAYGEDSASSPYNYMSTVSDHTSFR